VYDSLVLSLHGVIQRLKTKTEQTPYSDLKIQSKIIYEALWLIVAGYASYSIKRNVHIVVTELNFTGSGHSCNVMQT